MQWSVPETGTYKSPASSNNSDSVNFMHLGGPPLPYSILTRAGKPRSQKGWVDLCVHCLCLYSPLPRNKVFIWGITSSPLSVHIKRRDSPPIALGAIPPLSLPTGLITSSGHSGCFSGRQLIYSEPMRHTETLARYAGEEAKILPNEPEIEKRQVEQIYPWTCQWCRSINSYFDKHVDVKFSDTLLLLKFLTAS